MNDSNPCHARSASLQASWIFGRAPDRRKPLAFGLAVAEPRGRPLKNCVFFGIRVRVGRPGLAQCSEAIREMRRERKRRLKTSARVSLLWKRRVTARTRDRSCVVGTSDKLAKQPVKTQSASPDCRHRAGKGLDTNAEVPDTIAPWRGRLRTLSTRAREVLHGRGPLCPGSWDPHGCPRLTVKC